ncbi:MAG: protein kinase [Planctomycetes bacterium]|nr:protein kinase [Planctomycetota bacterium]
MRLTCPECSTEFDAPAESGTEAVPCPECQHDVSAAETVREESVPEITLPELCPFTPEGSDEGDEYSYYGSVLEYLSSLRDSDGSGPFTGVMEGASNVGDAGSHQLGEMIAQGGMGAVFNARDLNIRRNVAMKVMLDPEEADEKALLRFVEEAQITGQLEHPGIVPVHQLGIDEDGNVFYTMKYVRGLTLGEIIRGLKNEDQEIVEQYPLGKLLSVFAKVCDSMAFAHSRGVIHRDLKPANIMVGEFGEVLVMDWGLGKVLGSESAAESESEARESETGESQADASESETKQTPEPISSVRSPHKTDDDSRVDSVRTEDDASRTRAGAIMGTPTFMPPEQSQGLIEKLDATSDVYSLGAILYDLLFLVPPIRGESATDVLTGVIRGDVEYPEDLERSRDWALPHCPGDRVPTALSAVAMRALEWEQADRYQNVTELQREIEAWQSGFATQAEEAGRWRQISLFIQRNRGLATAFLAIFIALSIGLVATLIQWDKAVAAKQEVDKLFGELQTEEGRRKGEYEARQRVSRDAAPEFVAKARDFLNLGKSEEAQTAITTALALHEELPSAWFEKVASNWTATSLKLPRPHLAASSNSPPKTRES